jgi:8-oxo-dGTP diphosphatase
LILFLRHAWAGDSSAWQGDDLVRPLDERGLRQARALVDALSGYELRRIVTSPALRCVQTVEPLAKARGLAIEVRDELREERQHRDGRTLMRELAGDGALACGHGGIGWLVDDERRFKKGATLVLDDELQPLEWLPAPK